MAGETRILGFDHTQIVIPRGEEERARAFYGEILGLTEIPKPAALAGRGGVWFAVGDLQLHLGVEDDFRPQRKAHPAFRVSDLAAVRARLEASGASIAEDVPLPGRSRFETRDPFGNRLEFQQLDAPLPEQTSAEDSVDREALRERVQATFGPNAEAYVNSPSHAGGADLERLMEVLAPQSTETALDVSTGGGHTALALASRVARVVVSDLTPRMLAAAREHLAGRGVTNAEYVIADAERLPFLDATFDVVTVRIAPHHYGDVARAVREMARVLRPGGRLGIIDNIAPEDPALDALLNDWERRRDPSHLRSHTLAQWRQYITDAGLHVTVEEVGRKRLSFGPWAERTRMTPEAQAALEADMLAAPPAAREYFEITADEAGRLDQWTMEYALLRGERRSSRDDR